MEYEKAKKIGTKAVALFFKIQDLLYPETRALASQLEQVLKKEGLLRSEKRPYDRPEMIVFCLGKSPRVFFPAGNRRTVSVEEGDITTAWKLLSHGRKHCGGKWTPWGGDSEKKTPSRLSVFLAKTDKEMIEALKIAELDAGAEAFGDHVVGELADQISF